eukprot:5822498-Pleurochrysis_carterae.AAC.3
MYPSFSVSTAKCLTGKQTNTDGAKDHTSKKTITWKLVAPQDSLRNCAQEAAERSARQDALRKAQILVL